MAKVTIDLKGYEEDLKQHEKNRVLNGICNETIALVLDSAIEVGIIKPYTTTANDRLREACKKLAEAESRRRDYVVRCGRDCSYADMQKEIKKYPSLISEVNKTIEHTGIVIVESVIPAYVNFRAKNGIFIHIDDINPKKAEYIGSIIEKLDLTSEIEYE